jgi:hypothetical protein
VVLVLPRGGAVRGPARRSAASRPFQVSGVGHRDVRIPGGASTRRRC